VAPYYVRPTQEGMYRHFATIAESGGLPIYLYNIPSRTGVDMSNDTIKRLAKAPNIIGLKDATSNMPRVFDLAGSVREDFALFAGDDETALPFMLLGGHGVISVAANLFPATVRALCDAALSGNVPEARKINRRLSPAYRALSLETNPSPVKWALHAAGKIDAGIRLPLLPLSEQHREPLKRLLNDIA
jgi:4-hydroxy-tetrahydrodipicolinate synthase